MKNLNELKDMQAKSIDLVEIKEGMRVTVGMATCGISAGAGPVLDALKAVSIPAVEVHISDVDAREPFRQISYAGMACEKTIKGQGLDGYWQAICYLTEKYGK